MGEALRREAHLLGGTIHLADIALGTSYEQQNSINCLF
jgi:hypothetical protein